MSTSAIKTACDACATKLIAQMHRCADLEDQLAAVRRRLAVCDAALAWIDEHYPDATRDLPESISDEL